MKLFDLIAVVTVIVVAAFTFKMCNAAKEYMPSKMLNIDSLTQVHNDIRDSLSKELELQYSIIDSLKGTKASTTVVTRIKRIFVVDKEGKLIADSLASAYDSLAAFTAEILDRQDTMFTKTEMESLKAYIDTLERDYIITEKDSADWYDFNFILKPKTQEYNWSISMIDDLVVNVRQEKRAFPYIFQRPKYYFSAKSLNPYIDSVNITGNVFKVKRDK